MIINRNVARMEWNYVKNEQSHGPVSGDQLKQLVSDGELNAETLIWTAGMTEWESYRSQFTQQQPPPLPLDNQTTCTVCGQHFDKSDVISFDQHAVCISCKPIFVQRLKEGTPLESGTVSREGTKVVMGLEAKLPDRCVKCNAPASHHLPRKLHWHNPALYLLILLNLLIYAVVAMCVRRKASISVGLCDIHFKKRKNAQKMSWAIALCSIMVLIGGALLKINGTAVFLGFFCMIVFAGIYGISKSRIVVATKIDKEFIRIKGAGKEFLDSLPEIK